MFAWSGRDEITLLADCLFAAKGICFLLSTLKVKTFPGAAVNSLN